MKRLLFVAACCTFALAFGLRAVEAVPLDAPADLTPAQVEKLVQPIALYPDLLLQQVLAASTFPEQILDAALYNEQGKDPKGISAQPWDDSVKAVANYPSIVTMLAKDLDWTITLGSTFINQTDQVRTAIQTLRARAKTLGNLEDTQGQNVIEEQTPKGDTVIRIEPTDPQVVYVPSSTTVIYEERSSSSDLLVPVATFGLGMALGYAMGDDDDDDNHYYGGFYGPGFWHSDDAVNNWVDYRHDRWNDTYDYARDRQEWRQDSAEDWREHRQDLTNKQSEWRNEARKNAGTMTPAKRAEAQSRLSTAKSQTPEQRQQALQNRASSSARVDQAKQRTSGGSFSRTGTANYSEFDRSAAKSRASEQAAARRSSSDRYQQRARTSSYGSTARKPSTRTQPSRYSSGSSLSSMNSGSRSMSSASSRGSMSRGRSGGGGRGRR